MSKKFDTSDAFSPYEENVKDGRSAQMINDLADSETLKILPELKSWIRPLSENERANLKRSIEAEGVREPLTVATINGQKVLLDGHNRYEISMELGGEDEGYPVEEHFVEVETVEEAKLWMIKNQVGKRNLSKREMSFYRGNHYLTNKGSQGQSSGTGKLHEVLAGEYGVSPKSIQNDAMVAEILNACSHEFRFDYFDGELKVTLARFKDAKTLIEAKEIEEQEAIESFLKGEEVEKAVKKFTNRPDNRSVTNAPKKFTYDKFVKTLSTLVDAELKEDLNKAEKLSMEIQVKSLIEKYKLDI